MKKLLSSLVVLLTLTIFSCVPDSFSEGHYYPGVIGIRDGTVTPPGVFFFGYLPYYTSEKFIASNNTNIPLKVDVQNFVPQLLWSTGHKVLGGDLAIVVVPSFSRMKVKNTVPSSAGSQEIRETDWGIGDLSIAPVVLGWRGKSYEVTIGDLVSIPTGDFKSNELVNPGLGYWSNSVSARAHVYSDEARSTVGMFQMLYEINGNQQNTDFRAGDNFAVEWGISQSICSGYELGIAGYNYWQVTNDKGNNLPPFIGKERVHAVGGQLAYWLEFQKLLISVRSLKEFDASSRSEGYITTFNLSYQF